MIQNVNKHKRAKRQHFLCRILKKFIENQENIHIRKAESVSFIRETFPYPRNNLVAAVEISGQQNINFKALLMSLQDLFSKIIRALSEIIFSKVV